MPFNKEASIRYLIIDSCLTDRYKPYPTITDLMEICEEKLGKQFSVSTIQKDIKAMKEDEELGYMAPIRYSRSEDGYYYADENYTIKKVPLNSDEIESLEFAAGILEQYKGIKVNETFNQAVNKVLTSLKQKRMEKECRSVLIPDLAPVSKGFELIDILLHCICNEIPVSFAHYSYNEQRFCAHIVHPYLLKEHRNRWYVFGYSEIHKEVRQFGLDRLNDIILVDRKFYRQQGIDTAKLYNHAIGVFLSDEKKLTTVVLKFNAVYANFVKTQPLHPSQVIVEYGESGSVTIRIKVYPSRELVSLILSFGSGVVIESPGWLRSDIMRELKIAFEINKKLESEMKQSYGK